MKELWIVVVDDSAVVRDHLNRVFAKVKGCRIVGLAANGDEGLSMIRALQPHVVILDISMPHRNGIEVLREIRKENSTMVIVMFTADPSVVLEEICLKEGANYYLGKTQAFELIEICTGQLEQL